MTPAVTPAWSGLHCYLHWQPRHVDEFLTGAVAPLLDRLRAQHRIAGWFYIRYWEGGPHLRIRFRDGLPGTGRWLCGELTRLVAEAPHPVPPLTPDRYHAELGRTGTSWHRHGEVNAVAYRPEVERYGGQAALSVAEDVFCRATEVAVRVVAATGTPRARLAAAAELAIATAAAIDLDRLAAARWLRAYAGSWRWRAETAMLPPVVAQAHAIRVLAAQSPALQRRWARVTGSAGTRDESPVRAWRDAVRAARHRLEGVAPGEPAPAAGRWLAVWASQLHMLLNRLGVTPDEERSLCWLIAGAALLPGGLSRFFEDGVDAPDRRFQESCKYLPGQLDDQRPPDADPDPPRAPWPPGRGAVTLPADELGTVALADALKQRRSARGRLAGPVTDRELGRLLWTASGSYGTARIRAPGGAVYDLPLMPYPSAGQKYPARIRLVARTVAALEPGVYHADPVDRRLRRIGPAPSQADLEATSMWFGAAAVPEGGIDLAGLPALLGLYLDLSALRARYGLRALRFGLVEAGHVAQNLALVAAGTGLSIGMVGGFYDDVAHEVFGLDGVDEVLVYLLPVGKRTGQPHH